VTYSYETSAVLSQFLWLNADRCFEKMLCGYVQTAGCAVCSGLVSGTAGSYTDRSKGIGVLCLLCVM